MATLHPMIPIIPNRGLAFMILGVSLHDILNRLKAQPQRYPTIHLSYSSSHPVNAPVVVQLPENGLRLRFDGPDQRLRLIEVLDFTKCRLTYKNIEIVKVSKAETSEAAMSGPTGPTFRHVYNRLFGPTFPGEYLPPKTTRPHDDGTYILSYPGVAFSFPLQTKAWSPAADFISLLSSPATSPAISMAIFNGSSWPDARTELFTRPPPNPRSLLLAGRAKEGIPDEIELVQICGEGRIQMLRNSGAAFLMTLSETTTQDLVAELGPPDAIYRKNDRRLSIHRGRVTEAREAGAPIPPSPMSGPIELADTDRSSASDDSERELESGVDGSDGVDEPSTAECFYNYFNHGFDVFISNPTTPSPPAPAQVADGLVASGSVLYPSNLLTANKLLLHSNVPGSYPFNRHRRSRWTIEHASIPSETSPLDSEMSFDIVSTRLKEVWKSTYAGDTEEKQLQRGMVLNRGWGDSPGSSCELLGGWEESVAERRKAGEGEIDPDQGLGNTELFGFPGMVFEVLKNGTVACLTVF